MDVVGLPWFFKLLSLPTRLIQNNLFKKADLISVASLDYIEHSQIKNIYKKYQKKFKEIPFGVENKFKPWSHKNKNHLLFVGGLDQAHYFKGIYILLKALAQLKKEKPNLNWEMQIVGDGDLRPDYEERAKKLKLDQVKFLGKISDEKLPSIYNHADLFILPSINSNEAFGLVLLEAMASGLPVIASNLPGVRKVFENNRQGLLTEANNYEDLKEKIKQLLDNPDKLKKMKKEAEKLIEHKYNWDRVGEKLSYFIRNL